MPIKFSRLISVICLIGIVIFGIVGFSQSSQFKVRLTTSPPISEISPFEAEAEFNKPPVQLNFLAVDAAGQPLKDAKIHLQIFTPHKTPWFTTDFPIVEGTKLLDLKAVAPDGELQLQQVFPIRGTYRFLIDVSPQVANAFTPFQQTLTLSIAENWVKYKNFAILAAILLAAGLGGGWVIGAQHPIQLGEIAPQRVRLLLSGTVIVAIAVLLFVNVSAEIAQSHLSMPMSHISEPAPPSDKPGMMQSQGIEVRLSGDTSAVVGKLANLQVNLSDTKTKQPITDVGLKITTTQLENDWVAFAYQGVSNATGQFAWQQQFFDGAPHKLEVEISPQLGTAQQFSPFQVAQTIKVEGVAPPLLVRLISLTYFTSVIAVGLILGLWLRRQTRLQHLRNL